MHLELKLNINKLITIKQVVKLYQIVRSHILKYRQTIPEIDLIYWVSEDLVYFQNDISYSQIDADSNCSYLQSV